MHTSACLVYACVQLRLDCMLEKLGSLEGDLRFLSANSSHLRVSSLLFKRRWATCVINLHSRRAYRSDLVRSVIVFVLDFETYGAAHTSFKILQR